MTHAHPGTCVSPSSESYKAKLDFLVFLSRGQKSGRIPLFRLDINVLVQMNRPRVKSHDRSAGDYFLSPGNDVVLFGNVLPEQWAGAVKPQTLFETDVDSGEF